MAGATRFPDAAMALPGRSQAIPTASHHHVNQRPLLATPDGHQVLLVGMGCFWGAERAFWSLPGVWVTAVGYAGGQTPNPTYQEVCSGLTGHAEVVRIVFDPKVTGLDELLTVFWERHDPTQGMRQGGDIGSQYRSMLCTDDGAAMAEAEGSRAAFQTKLTAAGFGAITTELRGMPPFYPAEAMHQQYLAKNPDGYCGLGGTGLRCGPER